MTQGDGPPAAVAAWHRVVETRDPELVAPLLADDVVFRSPAVHAPQRGRGVAAAYLRAAVRVLGPTLRYERQWWGEDSAVLEFHARLGDLDVHGVDMLAWDVDGLLVEFTVMVRPLSGLHRLVELMRAELEAGA